MKRTMMAILACVMALSLVACGSNGAANTDTIESVAETYSLDLASTEQQTMSNERAAKEQLSAVVHDYLKGETYFLMNENPITYADLKAQIGTDASIYYCESDKQCFLWIASDDETAKFLATFIEGELYATGSTNVN